MFCLAIVLGNAAEASAKFNRWLRAADPAGTLCPTRMECAYPWGWCGFAGRGHLIVRRGGNGRLLVVHGAVLDAKLRRELETSPDWEKLADRLPETTGQFVFACVREHPTKPILAGMDNLGMKSLFWSERNGVSTISNLSLLCGLLVGQSEQDSDYVRDLVIKDSVLPWKSMLRDVGRVQRGSYLTVTDGRVRTETNRFRDLHLQAVDRATALESLRQATRSLPSYGQSHLLGLTGGVDGRLMQALLMAEKIPFEAATHMMPCLDGDIARELAACAGVVHWPVGRSRGDAMVPLSKYFAYLPWSEGTYSWSVINQPSSVYDLVGYRGMIHLGGLGGEPARSYWDMASARYDSPEELIISRFFSPLKQGFYPNAKIAEQSRQDWLSLTRVEETVDRFVSMQVAYHDARLRGPIVLRANSTAVDYAWPLSNPEFYAYAWRLPRAERQAGVIFDDFIRELAPALLAIRWNKGNAGTYVKGGLQGLGDAAKDYIKKWEFVHVLRSKWHRPARHWSWPYVRRIVLAEFFGDPEVREWLRLHFGETGIGMVATFSPSYVSQSEKMVDLYLSWHFLRALHEANRPRTFWDLAWVRNAMAKISRIEN